MFHKALLKLTGWYLLILMVLSLGFSVIVYQLTVGEVSRRITGYESHLEQPQPNVYNMPGADLHTFRDRQIGDTRSTTLIRLIYINLVVLLCGGIGSYLLAKRTLQPIEQAHRDQSRFTSDASHELRTPLAAMKTELEVALRDSKLTKPDMRELLQSNLEEVNKLTKLSTTLLQLSNQKGSKLARTTLSLRDTISHVVQRYDIAGKRIAWQAPKNPLTITAQADNLEELLTILIDNAKKYSPNDSVIKLTAKAQNGKIIFAISNRGDGISAEDLPHIFDRFYQANAARSGQHGYGLGLALAKQIVELHNGELAVTSAKHATTTFRVILPQK